MEMDRAYSEEAAKRQLEWPLHGHLKVGEREDAHEQHGEGVLRQNEMSMGGRHGVKPG